MNRWKIEIILKSGEHINGYYEGEETDSSSVAKTLLTGSQHTLNSISSSVNSQLWFLVGEVAACIITVNRRNVNG